MKSVYEYIKQKAKISKVSVDDLYEKCGASKTSMYRIIKGFAIPTLEVEDKLATALKLNDEEKAELRYLYKISQKDKSLIQAHADLNNLLFQNQPEDVPKIDVILYEKRKYIITYQELFEEILQVVSAEDFSCDIKIVGSSNISYTEPISEFINKVTETTTKSVEIEHLIQFSEDSHENIVILKSIIPLLKHKLYKIYAYDSEKKQDKDGVSDWMLLQYTANGEKKNLHISLTDTNYSDCYAFKDAMLYEFLNKKYEDNKKRCSNSIQIIHNIAFYNDKLFDIEKDNEVWLYKQNPCYNIFPPVITKSIISRLTNDYKDCLLEQMGRMKGNYDEANEILKALSNQLEKRYQLSSINKRVDIFTAPGLQSFATTGRLTDHVDFIPEYSVEERKATLKSIRDRGSDPNDNFEYFIAPMEMNDGLTIEINSGGGILLEYLKEGRVSENVYFESKLLANVFIDFTENYLPVAIALKQRDAEKYLNELIDYLTELENDQKANR